MATDPAPENAPEARLRALLSPIIYGDVFDFPLTIDELQRFCTCAMTREELDSELRANARLMRVVHHRDGLYHLVGRDELVPLRQERREASKTAWRLARRVIGCIRHVPFIRGVLVTGSLAVENARQGDDLDFLIMTAPRRFWIVFGVLGVLQRLFSRRFLCPNYYISVDHLHLGRSSYYLAREVVQARPILGAECCRRFDEENRWAYDYFPNADSIRPRAEEVLERRGFFGWLTRCVEWPLKGALGDAAERLARKLLKGRLYAHYGKHGHDVPEDVLHNALEEVELRFHGLGHEDTILQAVKSREARLDPLLDGHSSPPTTP